MNKIQFIRENFETILPNDIRDSINEKLTRELRSIIKEKGLYDTGFMYDITQVKVSVNKTIGTFRINITTSNYFKYLDEEYSLTQSFINSNAYRNAIQIFDELSQERYDEYVDIQKELKNYYK